MTTSTEHQRILIIAGPNGAGKTTFATEFLPNEAVCPHFVNADLIAAGLSPFQPEAVAMRAGRLLLEQIDAFVRHGESFAFETTLSGRGYACAIPRWRQVGFQVELFFLHLPDAATAVARVAQRVREGGHNVPEVVVRRRYVTGWRNFQHLYRPLVDRWAVYDNSGGMPILLDRGESP